MRFRKSLRSEGPEPLDRKKAIGLSLVAVHLVMAVVALGLPWYSGAMSSPGGQFSFNFYLSGSTHATCTGSPNVSTGSCASSQSFTGAGLSDTGTLYAACFLLMLVGIAVFVLGFVLVYRVHTREQRLRRLAILSMSLGVAICFSSAIILPATQNGTLANDRAFTSGHYAYGFGVYDANGSPVSTPTTDYLNSTSIGGASMNWGPGIGWWIGGVGGFAFSLGGMILYGSNPRKVDLEEATDSSVPSASRTRRTDV